jgi:hypothetical protein
VNVSTNTPRRIVSQPRITLLPESPTFQAYVDEYDRPRNPQTSSYASLDHLRAEYISTFGDNSPVWMEPKFVALHSDGSLYVSAIVAEQVAAQFLTSMVARYGRDVAWQTLYQRIDSMTQDVIMLGEPRSEWIGDGEYLGEVWTIWVTLTLGHEPQFTGHATGYYPEHASPAQIRMVRRSSVAPKVPTFEDYPADDYV